MAAPRRLDWHFPGGCGSSQLYCRGDGSSASFRAASPWQKPFHYPPSPLLGHPGQQIRSEPHAPSRIGTSRCIVLACGSPTSKPGLHQMAKVSKALQKFKQILNSPSSAQQNFSPWGTWKSTDSHGIPLPARICRAGDQMGMAGFISPRREQPGSAFSWKKQRTHTFKCFLSHHGPNGGKKAHLETIIFFT